MPSLLRVYKAVIYDTLRTVHSFLMMKNLMPSQKEKVSRLWHPGAPSVRNYNSDQRDNCGSHLLGHLPHFERVYRKSTKALHNIYNHTWKSVDVIRPCSSFAIPTSVWSAVLCKGELSTRSRCTPAAMLHTKDAVTSFGGHIGTFFDSFSSSLVVSS